MTSCVVIPPFIKPYSPSYTAGIIADIIRKSGVATRIIDANILFLNHIYNNDLVLLSDGTYHSIESLKLDALLKAFKEKSSLESLTQELYDQTFNEISLRNIFLNKYIGNITFGFFDIRMKKLNCDISETLINDSCAETLIRMYAEFLPTIEDDIIFISIMSREQLYFSYLLSLHLKKQKVKGKIVVGGPYFENGRSIYELLLSYFDCICLGDAELVLPDILYNYSTDKKLFSNYGVVVYDGDRLIETQTTFCKVEDIEKFSFSMFDFASYNYYYPICKYPLLTSRECCYGKCLFCTNKGKSQHICRIEKASHIISILKSANLDKYSLIEFIDDNIHPRYMKLIADDFIESNLNIKWISNTRFYNDFLDFGLCKQLYDSGCKKLFMGLESYNQETLDSMQKGIVVSNIIPILKNMKDAGIRTHISILFGFPGETLEQAKTTQKFLNDNNSLLDLVEVNRFVSHGMGLNSEASYDVEAIVKETRIQIKYSKKSPTYYNVYRCLL